MPPSYDAGGSRSSLYYARLSRRPWAAAERAEDRAGDAVPGRRFPGVPAGRPEGASQRVHHSEGAGAFSGGGTAAHPPDGGQESPGGGVPTGPISARLGRVLQASRGGGAVRPVRSLDHAAAASLHGEAVAQRALATVSRPVVLVSPRTDPAVSPSSELHP